MKYFVTEGFGILLLAESHPGFAREIVHGCGGALWAPAVSVWFRKDIIPMKNKTASDLATTAPNWTGVCLKWVGVL